MHSNLGCGPRGAMLRSQGVAYLKGGSLCDHEHGQVIGTRGYADHLRAKHGMSIHDAWVATAAGGIRAYSAMPAAQRQALHARFAGVPAMSHPFNMARARAVNPALPG